MENNELISFGDLPVSDLMHYGTLGMKWGVRRYQNKDGSLTAAGKKRRAKLEAELDKLGGKKSNGEPETPKPKTVGEMSDAELREAVNRLQLEKQFKTLQSEMNPKKVSAGKEFVGKLGKKLGDAAAEAAGSAGRTFMEKKLKEVLGVDEKSLKKSKTAYEVLKEKVDMLDMQKRYDDHHKDNALKNRADEVQLKKQMLENEKRIRELKSESKGKPVDKTTERLNELKREKERHEMERQIEALEKLKANGWVDPRKEDKKK